MVDVFCTLFPSPVCYLFYKFFDFSHFDFPKMIFPTWFLEVALAPSTMHLRFGLTALLPLTMTHGNVDGPVCPLFSAGACTRLLHPVWSRAPARAVSVSRKVLISEKPRQSPFCLSHTLEFLSVLALPEDRTLRDLQENISVNTRAGYFCTRDEEAPLSKREQPTAPNFHSPL